VTNHATTDDAGTGAPFAGVDAGEWAALIARGQAAGVVHAESVTHVLRNVELTSEVITSVSRQLKVRGIEIDETVEEVVDDPTPPAGHARPEEADTVVEEDALERRRRQRASRMAERHETGQTSDTVRMYLKEIGRVSLLSAEDERRLAQAIEDGNLAAQQIDDTPDGGCSSWT
jgi:RNA polymerase primary sigma factor